MYFTDRLYSHKELPSVYKKKISQESKAAASKAAAMADKPAPGPAGSCDQGHRKEADENMGAALQTTTSGQDYMRGIQSILNSVEKEPFKLWRKEVSIYKTIYSFKPAGLVLVLRSFPIINIITAVCYTLIVINWYHR